MRRLLAAAVAATVLATACGGGDDDDFDTASTTVPTGGATTAVAPEASPGLNGFVPAPIAWEGCGGGMECATLTVPLDWDVPDGPTIELAVTRRPAIDADERLGALVTNPGGPGAPGLDYVQGGGPFTDSRLARFDIVSWDPRGVGESSPVTCGDEVDAFRAIDSDPDDADEQAALDAAAQAVAAECGTENGDLLPNVGTDDTARDLEAIRIAMGVPMAYYGFSYGTLIGLRYATLFPQGARSIVLDGVVDPSLPLTGMLASQTRGHDMVLQPVLEGEHGETYDRVLAMAERGEIPVTGGGTLTPSDLATAAILVTYQSESAWEILRRGLRQAEAGDGSTILSLASVYRDLIAFTPYQAISCLDSVNPQGGEAWAAFAAELEAISPRFGAAIANEMLPCAFWPVPPQPVTGPVTAEGSPPILVISTTGDPATPYEQGVRVAEQLADGHLLTYDGPGHTAYGQNDCVDDAVAAYLVDGTLPEPGARCG